MPWERRWSRSWFALNFAPVRPARGWCRAAFREPAPPRGEVLGRGELLDRLPDAGDARGHRPLRALLPEAGADEVLVYLDGPPPGLAALDLRGLRWSSATTRSGSSAGAPKRSRIGSTRRSRPGSPAAAASGCSCSMRTSSSSATAPSRTSSTRFPRGSTRSATDRRGGLGPGRRSRRAVRQHLLPDRWRSDRLWQALGRPIYGEAARYMRRGLIGHVPRQGVSGRPDLLPHRQSRGRARRQGHHAPRRQHRAVAGRHVPRPLRRDRPRALDREVAAADRGETSPATWSRPGPRRWIWSPSAGPRRRAARALFRSLYGLTRPQYALLSLLGYAFRRRLFPSDA